MKKQAWLLALSGLLWSGLHEPAAAQAANSDPSAPSTANPCTKGSQTTEPGCTATDREKSLSSKLSRSQGTITPPSQVDPGIAKPTPSTGPGSMPVIPPPGSPGGNPQVEPK